MKTLLLDTGAWDLVADAAGNIAFASEPYALAQDVASTIRTFLGEVWYDTKLGIPYFQQILGHTPPITLFEEYMIAAALTVPGVVSATCIIEAFDDTSRTVVGQVQFTDSSAQITTVTL